MKNIGIIVDGYSTGSGLVTAFQDYNIDCIHIQSQENIPEVYRNTFSPDQYEKNLIFSKNLDNLIKRLKKYSPKFVLAGAECGVELADQIAAALHLVSNDISLSSCRRNKYLMVKKVEESHINTIPSQKIISLDALNRLIECQQNWPLVLKPLTSAGGEGVFFCKNPSETIEAYQSILSKEINMLGFKNNAVIAQEYIEGEEYVVNTVSWEGKHKLCEIWSYKRRVTSDGHKIYDTAQIIDYSPERHQDVVIYILKILDVLGVKYGAAHVEVIKNSKNCFFIELGARLMGANLPFSLLERSTTTPQCSMLIKAYAKNDVYQESCDIAYKVCKPLVAFFMISNKKGKIRSIRHLDKISSLPSFFSMKLLVSEGEKLHKTIDYQTSPGMIYLSHKSQSVLSRDVASIRKLEETMFLLEQGNEDA